MTLLANTYVEGVAFLLLGTALGYWLWRWRDHHLHAGIELQSKAILENARREAEAVVREARLTANEAALKVSQENEKEYQARRLELTGIEQRLAERDILINRQLEGLVQQEKGLLAQQESLKAKEAALAKDQEEVVHQLKLHRQELLKLAHLTEAEARESLLRQVEQEAVQDANDLTRHILENAKAKAEDEARRIVTLAIQRYAGEHSFESTTAAITLPNEEIKGRIIGREGRNIRAFESATGVTVLIDDTPNAVVLSSFDPVRREIARESMQRLILDGRIHPTRIEEVVSKVSEETEETIIRSGEEAVFQAGLPPLPLEIVKLLGRLRFRHSFSQNILAHAVEVAHLAGMIAAELGFDVAAAKRVGLLHDIGKAINHEVEGAHAIVGAEFLKRNGETEEIVNGVASHHGEVPSSNPLGILVSAADAISASRPGARSETMTTYIKRLENLEKIGLTFPGVEKCFAVQAGRELRVLVHPDQVDDALAFTMARNIARKIEDDLQYPGQIRVTVIRETRCVEFAK